jgi:hypothetical protein
VHPRVDVVSADDGGPAIVFAAQDGDVGVIDAKTGAQRASWKTGLRLSGASFDVDGWNPPAGGEAPHVRQALEAIIWDRDARFTAVKVFAATALGGQTGKEADAALLKIVRAPKDVPPLVQKRAGDELVARKSADLAPLLVEALKSHEDFVTDTHAVGVDVMARAAAALKLSEAAPLLCKHLADPATPQTSLNDIVRSLVALGGKEARRALKTFLLTYRGDPSYFGDPSPLTAAAEGLLKSGDPEDRRTVDYVSGDKWTLPPVAKFLQKATEKR